MAISGLRCKKCSKTFKGAQGLASHMRWHAKGGTTPKTHHARTRAPGPIQELFLTALEQFPTGGTCQEIAVAMQKGGYKPKVKLAEVAGRVSSVASNLFNRKQILRTGRGIYQLKAAGRPTSRPSPHQPDAVEQLTAPKLPAEALHLQIQHLEKENHRLRQVATILMSGD